MLHTYTIKKILPDLIVCLFVLNLAVTAGAATLTWSGGGADDLASTPGNWFGAVSPHHADAVIFDSTSSGNCTWDLNITLSSFNIHPGYTGTVTIDAGLIINNGVTWTGEGGDTLSSNPANWSGGAAPQDGDHIDFDGIKDCLWDLDISPASLTMGPGFTGSVTLITDLSIAGDLSVEGGLLNAHDNALRTNGDLLIGVDGTLYATSSLIQVNGDWINKGAFDSGTSTVMLGGSHQTVYGDNTFYNFVKTAVSAATLNVEAARTQKILNNLTLQGTAGHLLVLRSTESETSWFIDPVSTRNISYADIRDMKNINQIGVAADNSHNSGNNSNVSFDINQCM